MKRHLSILVCALVAIAMMFSLASCEETPAVDTHEHTYSDAWSNSATEHWHAAICTEEGCAEAKASVKAHVDADDDKFCDICAYDMGHRHTYSEDWSMDAENHWHDVSCGHIVASDKAAHNYVVAGLCSVCGYIEDSFDVLDVAKAAGFAEFFKDRVKSGEATYIYAYAGGEPSAEVATYEYGNNVTNVNVVNSYSTVDYWYSVSDGKFLAVSETKWSEDAEAEIAVDSYASDKLVNGFQFGKTFATYDADEFYGAEALVAGLYELATADFAGATQEYVTIVDGVVYYTFKFAHMQDEYAVYEVDVTFSLADDYSLAIVMVDSAKYNVSEYNYETGTEDVLVELTYDEAEEPNVIGYEILNYTPAVTYSYIVEQKVGERTLASKYDADKVMLSAFDLKLEDDTAVTDTIQMVAGTPLYLYLDNVAPETANLSLDSFDVSEENYKVFGNYDADANAIVLNAYGVGTYTVTIASKYVTKTYTVVATNAPTTSLTFENANEEEVAEKNLYLVAGGSVSFNFVVAANSYADESNTAVIKDAPAGATLVKNDDGTYTFTATALGTYEVVATSTVAEAVSATLKFTIVEAPEMSDVLNGKYAYEASGFADILVVVEFTPSSEGATDGTMTLDYTQESFFGVDEYSVVYTYAWTDGALVTTYVSGDEVEYIVAIGDDYLPTFAHSEDNTPVNMTPYVEPSNTPEAVVAGEYFCELDNGNRYYITLNADGTGTFVEKAFDNDNTYEWVDVANTIKMAQFTAVDNGDGTYSVDIQFQPGCPVAAGSYVVSEQMGKVGMVTIMTVGDDLYIKN